MLGVQLRSASVTPVYLLVDVSGSTVRSDLNGACNRVLPLVADLLEQRSTAEHRYHYGVICFAERAEPVVPLGEPAELRHIPALPAAAGLTRLAAGLRMLTSTIHRDAVQREVDGLAAFRPSRVLIITDGMPADPLPKLAESFTELATTVGAAGEIAMIVCGEQIGSELAGLTHRLITAVAGEDSLLAAVDRLVG